MAKHSKDIVIAAMKRFMTMGKHIKLIGKRIFDHIQSSGYHKSAKLRKIFRHCFASLSAARSAQRSMCSGTLVMLSRIPPGWRSAFPHGHQADEA